MKTTTENTVIENNKLIAEFMAGKKVKTHHNQYHTNWNELMPVIEKCLIGEGEAEGLQVDLIELIYENLNNIDIYKTFEAVINFIKWHNKNQ